jgi:hypothetical protein
MNFETKKVFLELLKNKGKFSFPIDQLAFKCSINSKARERWPAYTYMKPLFYGIKTASNRVSK